MLVVVKMLVNKHFDHMLPIEEGNWKSLFVRATITLLKLYHLGFASYSILFGSLSQNKENNKITNQV